MGSRAAAAEPKARKRTTAATATPTASARWPPPDSVSAMALPPSSTWSPSVRAVSAVSTTARACAGSMSWEASSKVTVAYAVSAFSLIRGESGSWYGLPTEATPGRSAMRSRVRVMVCSTSAARTVPDVVCQTIVSLSPPTSGKRDSRSR